MAYNEQKDDEFKGDISFPKLLFLHINRILQNLNDEQAFISNIEGLEYVLTPFIDDTYRKSFDKINKRMKLSNKDVDLKKRDAELNTLTLLLAKTKFTGLMRIMNDRKLLLQEDVWGEDE